MANAKPASQKQGNKIAQSPAAKSAAQRPAKRKEEATNKWLTSYGDLAAWKTAFWNASPSTTMVADFKDAVSKNGGFTGMSAAQRGWYDQTMNFLQSAQRQYLADDKKASDANTANNDSTTFANKRDLIAKQNEYAALKQKAQAMKDSIAIYNRASDAQKANLKNWVASDAYAALVARMDELEGIDGVTTKIFVW